MNAIGYAINMVNRSIPKEIRNLTFLSGINHMTGIPVTTDSRIRELVINDRVLEDINIIGGTQITVPLDGLAQEPIENNAVVIRIPKSRTQGRSIISVHSVAFGASAVSGFVSNPLRQVSEVANANQQMLNGMSSIPYIS